MNHLVIGIPTYKRPLQLERLIKSIYASNIDSRFISRINILIVDNDQNRTAELPSLKLKKICPNNFKFKYHNYSKKGLSNVRNEIIEKALVLEPDYILFVDDDEYVTENWLNELTCCIVKCKGDMAMGPVLPDFTRKVSISISHWFFRPSHTEGEQLYFIITGNLIMRSKFLLEYKVRFDPRFNTTGSEDSYFGISVLKEKGTIYWASKAIVYETIPESRAKLKWLLQRAYNGANTYMYTMILEKSYIKVIKKITVNSIYLTLGLFFLILLPFKFQYRYYGLLKLAEAMGGFTGMMNIKFNEYSKN